MPRHAEILTMPTTSPTASQHSEHLHKGVQPHPPRTIDVRSLLGDGQILMIEHGESRYLLRMTRNNKLILTK